MKLFSKFMSCWGLSARPAAPTTRRRTKDGRKSSPAGSDLLPCKKRGRLNGSKPVSASHWRPSLCAISEDKIVSVVPGKAENAVRKKAAGKTASKASFRVHSNDDEFRRASAPMTFPAFSPTAFLF